jgi:hypothetical protein
MLGAPSDPAGVKDATPRRRIWPMSCNGWSSERGGCRVIYKVTVALDLHTLDPSVPALLLGTPELQPGTARRVPGGVLVFQAAVLNTNPGEASVYRFALQFGAVHSAMQMGTWLFNQLRHAAAAISIAGILIPLDHRTIISTLEQVA